ncbi:MAG: hypothetical protein M5U05_19495 [Anaerolineales bacterium]|nr:hypothetical protein [Anaerolineales bacterium]
MPLAAYNATHNTAGWAEQAISLAGYAGQRVRVRFLLVTDNDGASGMGWTVDAITVWPAHAIQEFRPALKIEDFFDTYFALARAGKLNEEGLPNLLHMAVIMREYDREIRAVHPPRLVQQMLMWSLAPIGRLLGYRGAFPGEAQGQYT